MTILSQAKLCDTNPQWEEVTFMIGGSKKITDPANTFCVDPRRDISTTKRTPLPPPQKKNGKCTIVMILI